MQFFHTHFTSVFQSISYFLNGDRRIHSADIQQRIALFPVNVCSAGNGLCLIQAQNEGEVFKQDFFLVLFAKGFYLPELALIFAKVQDFERPRLLAILQAGWWC